MKYKFKKILPSSFKFGPYYKYKFNKETTDNHIYRTVKTSVLSNICVGLHVTFYTILVLHTLIYKAINNNINNKNNINKPQF